MNYVRDELIADLKENVIEVVYIEEDKAVTKRLTLNDAHIPVPVDMNFIDEHHSENPMVVVAWDTKSHGFKGIDIRSVEYCQIVTAW